MVAAVSIGAAAGALVGIGLGPLVAAWTATAQADGRWWWPGSATRPTGAISRRERILVTAIAAALAALGGAAGFDAGWPGLVLTGVVGAPLAVIDVRVHRLPDRLVLPLALAELVVLAVVTAVTRDGAAALRALIAAAATAIVLGGLALIVPRAFGMGDAKLATALAVPVGWVSGQAVVVGFVVAIVLGAVVAEILILARRARLTSAIAFGPALIVGYLGAAAALG